MQTRESRTDREQKTTSGWRKRLVVFAGLFVLLSASFIVLLPHVVSSRWIRTLLTHQASHILNRSIQLDDLHWRWSDGIRIEGLCIPDDPAFSTLPIVSLDRAHIRIRWTEFSIHGVSAEIQIDGLTCRMIRDASGDTNWTAWLSSFAKPEGGEQKPEDREPKHPIFPMRGKIHLNRIELCAEDRMQNRRFVLTDGLVHIDAPDSISESIRLKISSGMELDDRQLPPLALNLTARHLIDSEGSLDVNRIEAEVAGSLEGLEISAKADMNSKQIHSRIRADLARLSEVLEPLLPKPLSDTHVKGILSLAVDASGEPSQAITVQAFLNAEGLAVSGGLISNQSLGPLPIRLSAAGSINLKTGEVSVHQGSLALSESKIEIQKAIWNTPHSTLHLSAALNIGELFLAAKPFIPPSFPVSFDPNHPPVLNMKKAFFSESEDSESRLEFSEVLFHAPSLTIKSGDTVISANDLNLRIPKFSSGLKTLFPQTADITLGLNLKTIEIKGKESLRLDGLNISELHIQADSIQKSKTALFGVQSQFFIKETLSIDQIDLPSLSGITGVTHLLDAQCRMSDASDLQAVITRLNLSVSELLVPIPKKKSFKTNLSMEAAIPRITLHRQMDADLEGLKLKVAMADFLTADIEADIMNSGKSRLNSKGNILIHLSKAADRLSEMLPFRMSDVSGKSELTWNLAGRFPTPKEIKTLETRPPYTFKEDLAFLNRLELVQSLIGVNGQFKIQKSTFNIQNLTSKVQYVLNVKDAKATLTGNAEAAVLDISGLGRLDAPIRLKAAISGQHEDFKSAQLTQSLELPDYTFGFTSDLSLYGIDRAFKQSITPSLAWLKTIGGTIRERISIGNRFRLPGLIRSIEIADQGRQEADMEINLTPGQTIQTKTRIRIPPTDIHIGNGTRITQLQAHLNFEKTMRLETNQRLKDKTQKAEALPLSLELMKPSSVSVRTSKNDRVQRVMGGIQKRFDTRHPVVIERASFPSASVPLELNAIKLDLNLIKGLPVSDYFQADILGGTIVGSASITRQSDGFIFQIESRFSGINTANLFPQSEITSEDAELSGQFSITAPMVTRMKPMLEGVQAEIVFSHIGARSLERLLYALDPYESNESIAAQRRMLRTGTPRQINVSIRNGSLFLTGELEVKGVRVTIPPIERLNIANMTGLQKFERHLNGLTPIIEALIYSSADTLAFDKEGIHAANE